MKDKDLKKAFDSIKLDDSMKVTMLENINKKASEENLDINKLNKTYLNNNDYIKERGIFMNLKKSGIILASCAVLVGVFVVYNQSKNNVETNIQPPPSSSPLPNGEYVPPKEFSEFNIDLIKESVTEIDIRTHTNDNSFVTVNNNDIINELINSIENISEKEMSNEVYESIASSQSEGNSVTIRFVLKDGSYHSLRANLDLDIVCINDMYMDISPEFCNTIKNQVKDIDNFNSLNSPAPSSM